VVDEVQPGQQFMSGDLWGGFKGLDVMTVQLRYCFLVEKPPKYQHWAFLVGVSLLLAGVNLAIFSLCEMGLIN
jgi:hypothetical protein